MVNTGVYGSKDTWLGITTGSSIKLANFGDNIGTIAKGFSTEKLRLNKAFDNTIVHSALGNESAISRMKTFRGGTELDADDFEQTQWCFATGEDHFHEVDATWSNNTYNMLAPYTNSDVISSDAIPVVNFRYDSIRALITVEASASEEGTSTIKRTLHDYCENFSTAYPKIIHVYMALYERKNKTWSPLSVMGNKGIFIWNPSKYFAHTNMTGKTFTEGLIGRPICVDYGRYSDTSTIIVLGKFNEGNSAIHKDDMNLVSADFDVYFDGTHGYFYKDYFEGFEEYAMHQVACFGIQFATESEYITLDLEDKDITEEDAEHIYMGVLDESFVGHGDFINGKKILESDLYDKEAEEVDYNPNIESSDFGDLETDVHAITGGNGGHTIYNMTEDNMALLVKFANSEESGEGGQNYMEYIKSIKFCPFGFSPKGSEETVHLGGHPVSIDTTAVKGCRGFRVDGYGSNPITISRYYKDFRDFEPYTKLTLKIPFGESVQLPLAEWYGHNLHVVISSDEMTGSGVAKIYRDNLIYQTVNCSTSIDVPITTLNAGTYHNALVNARTQRNSALIGIGASAVGVGANISSANAVGSTMAVAGFLSSVDSYKQSDYNLTHMTKPISHVGGTGDMTNFLMSWYPQIVYERCDKLSSKKGDKYYFDFDKYAETVGYACCRATTLDSETGFVVVNNIDLQNCSLTESEKASIIQMLSQGIII